MTINGMRLLRRRPASSAYEANNRGGARYYGRHRPMTRRNARAATYVRMGGGFSRDARELGLHVTQCVINGKVVLRACRRDDGVTGFSMSITLPDPLWSGGSLMRDIFPTDAAKRLSR